MRPILAMFIHALYISSLLQICFEYTVGFWLVLYIVVGWKDAKSNNEVKKEITQMNELLLEQNSQLKEQNKHLNMVILSVCSKSVRDRKNAEGGKYAQTETGGKQVTLEKETKTENTTATEDRRTSVSSEV